MVPLPVCAPSGSIVTVCCQNGSAIGSMNGNGTVSTSTSGVVKLPTLTRYIVPVVRCRFDEPGRRIHDPDDTSVDRAQLPRERARAARGEDDRDAGVLSPGERDLAVLILGGNRQRRLSGQARQRGADVGPRELVD